MIKVTEKRKDHWKKRIVATDVADMAEQIAQLEHLSEHDEKTDLYNYRGWKRNLEFYVKLCDDNKEPMAFLLADIDELKKINDSYGHIAGDQAIKLISRIIKSAVRDSDIVARIGGDEFLIGLPFTDMSGADLLIERINLKIKKAIESVSTDVTLRRIPVSLSIGVSVRAFGEDPKVVIERADRDMYFHKQSSKNV